MEEGCKRMVDEAGEEGSERVERGRGRREGEKGVS